MFNILMNNYKQFDNEQFDNKQFDQKLINLIQLYGYCCFDNELSKRS